MKRLLLPFLLMAAPAFASVAITANVPAYNFQVLPGSTRQINVGITGGVANTVNWSVVATTGGASASFTTPAASLVNSVSAGLPTVQVNLGTAAGNCSIPQAQTAIGKYTVTSTATVTVQAQSTDDTSKTATFLFNVCANTTTVLVAPAYRQAYQGQHISLQSWVTGNTDETGTWSIVTQPSSGNGKLADTGNRDADFTASVTGRYTLQYTSHADPSKSSTAIVYVTTSGMPYAATPNRTEPRACAIDPAFTGAVYEVGAGKTYPTLQSVPSAGTWVPGTIMRVWNTDTTGANPSTFHEYFQVHNSGTATQPIVLCGVPDSSGNLPIIDGANATTQSGTSTGAAAAYGVISLWGGGYGGGSPYGYYQGGSSGPSYVTVSGLHIEHGSPLYTYTLPSGSGTAAYVGGASCINVRSGSYLDLSGNDLDTCGNGLFTAENTNSAWAPVTQEVTVEGNHIHGSGNAGSYTEHQVYFQSFYGLFQGNRVENYNPAAQGSNIKWRGVEGIFRYNYVGNGPARDFDLVENQDAAPYVSFEAYLSSPGQTNCNASMYCLGDTAGPDVIAAFQESAQKDFIYGNMIFGASSVYQNHYNEDHDGLMAARNGVLYYYSNTLDAAHVVFDTGNANGYNSYYTPRIDARNNLLWTVSSQTEFGRYASTILSATTNLMQSGTFSIGTPLNGGNYNAGTSNGWEATCDSGICPWPLTTPIEAHLYGLSSANYLATATLPYDRTTLLPVSGSAAIGAGTALTGTLATMPVRWQYAVATGALAPRTNPLTIGAADTGVQGNVPPTAATPTFSPAPGTFSTTQTVSLSDTTSGAKIYYTTDGTTPTTSSPLYSAPITVSTTTTLQAIAVASGYTNSSIGSATFTITAATTAATPTFSPAPGTFTTAQTVSLSDATSGAKIYYTTNGTTPTTSSPLYSAPITVSTTTTLQAIAVASGYTNSSIGSATFTITAATTAATPTFSLAGGSYPSAQTVSMGDATAGATIRYTMDGSTPTAGSAVYSGPLVVSGTTTLRAIATAAGYTNSAVNAATYTITATANTAATPTFSLASATYSSPQTVAISATTAGSHIFYTTDGTTPSIYSNYYRGPFTVSTTTTVRAIATVTGMTNSAVNSATYTISTTSTANTAAMPIFSLAGGSYASAQTVSMSDATAGATIRYTTDGSTPTAGSAVYSGPLVVSGTTTLRAIATASGYTNSAVNSATYTITATTTPPANTAVTPTFSLASGTYSAAQTLAISAATAGSHIFYTTDGTTPSIYSTYYRGPFTVSSGTTTVRAIVTVTGMTNSAVNSATYTIP
jgi:hypothetical protein